ncbi:hypothetical protein H0H87_000817, partial [Tephrocybe sp. NHM501043]
KSTGTSPTSTSSGFSKGFLGLAALVFAVLLYNVCDVGIKLFRKFNNAPQSDFFWQTLVPEGKGRSHLPADIEKRDAIVAAFKHSWTAYERDAMGDDNYHPISKTGTNLTDAGGIGYTVIDSLDTIQLMGLDSEYARARKWIANSLSFDRDGNFNTFEASLLALIRLDSD